MQDARLYSSFFSIIRFISSAEEFMANKGALASGLSGASMLALLLTPPGMFTTKTATESSASTPVTTRPSNTGSSQTNEGPWNAVCSEYRAQFERGPQHSSDAANSKGEWTH